MNSNELYEEALKWASNLKPGMVVNGIVKNMRKFGVFVEITEGVDGLIHISQIANKHVAKPQDELKVGQEVEAKIVDFNEEDKKISLSIKALVAPEEDAADEEVASDIEE